MLAEDQFYDNLFRRLPAAPPEVVVPPGDDCAGVEFTPGTVTLYTVDQVAADVHYCKTGNSPARPEEVARKLLARNISDIAAMGGRPLYCLTAIVQQNGEDKWLNSFFGGLADYARQFGIAVIGGDIITSPDGENASLTLIGEVESRQVCRRNGAEERDILFATGSFGNSFASGWHMSFQPRYEEGRWLAENGFAKAMIDVSDGLLLDAFRICRASGVSLILDTASIPLRSDDAAYQQALTEGEDYELLLAVGADRAEELVRSWPFDIPLTQLGTFSAHKPSVIEDARGNYLAPAENIGYQQGL